MNTRNRLALILTAFLVAILMLSSCSMPVPTEVPVALSTPTESPVESSSTPTVQTPAVVDTPTGTPAADCDLAEFVTDVTYPDNTSVDASEKIIKTWRVKNAGNCTWDAAYRLVFIRGEQMDGVSPAEVITDPVAPGKTVELSIDLTVPTINGIHWGVWQIHNAAGKPVLKADGTPEELTILINIENGQGGKVTSVRTWSYTFTGTKCSSAVQYDVVAYIYANGPVDVKYTWTVSNGALTVVSQDYVFSNAGNVEVTTSIVPPFTDPNNIVITLSANGISSSFTICP